MKNRTRGERNRLAALTLVVLGPLVAELALGSTPVRMAWLLLLWLPIYGAGVLLIRELVRRFRGGWLSVILLGVAYELVEDGIALQALSSPHLYGAAGWAPRVFGLNSAYLEANLPYHVVFSVTVPILLTDLLFPRHRHVPYLGRTGLAVTGLCALAGVALLRVSVPPNQDPGYMAPPGVLLGCLVAVAVLAVIALGVLPRRAARPRTDARVPSARALAGGGFLATLAFMGLLFPFWGAAQPAFTHGLWVLLPMAAAAVVAVGTGLLVHRWSASSRWDDRRCLALAGGALIAHTVFGVVGVADTALDRAGLVVLGLLTAWLLLVLARRPPAAATG
ncbi:hypothetical protein ACWEN6_37635 [Sphaerisporangium sp. NPDC004334]